MNIGSCLDSRIPWVRRISDLEHIENASLCEYRRLALTLSYDFSSGQTADAIHLMPRVDYIFPTVYLFGYSYPPPWDYMRVTHHSLLVQVKVEEAIRNILVSPTDVKASLCAPILKRAQRTAVFGSLTRPTCYPSLEHQLRALGLGFDDIDLVLFERFCLQDLRPLIGTNIPENDGTIYSRGFKNAIFFIPKDLSNIHPYQNSWYVKDGFESLIDDHIVFFDDDLILGDSALLLRMKGQTSFNHSFFVHTKRGIIGYSANAYCVDSWAPYESTIPKLKKKARIHNLSLLPSNQPSEIPNQHYNAMLFERNFVDNSSFGFPMMIPSFELSNSLLIKPGLQAKRWVDSSCYL